MPKLYFQSKRTADLPLHYGKVPPWLAQRMSDLAGPIVESVILDYGHEALLTRLSDPLWFQAFGAVLGMDWHSSGITTSVMGALKRAVNTRFSELGVFICGGKGKHSRQTPFEILSLAEKTGLNGDVLVRSSKLSAKVDNGAVQDGFQVYLHSFIVSKDGSWTVVQQGMNEDTGMARRYHWRSGTFSSFVEEPHAFIYGHNQGKILNLTDRSAQHAKDGMLSITREDPAFALSEVRKIVMPSRHHVTAADVNLKRLGGVLALAHEKEVRSFEELLLLEGVGPRTIQSLALVSEVIHGTPTRFTDPARFSFAHGGKDGHPFPVPTRVYDETIDILRNSVEKSRIGDREKSNAIRCLSTLAQQLEESFEPDPQAFDRVVETERRDAHKFGGRTVFGKSMPPKDSQLKLF